ncbi:Uncharacterized protein dnm_062540 [Desulfonema magnum]|uniref:Uncharacterized protein n=1 Tax=Desulfonema magnum TaxID=45655 RepID=A0A975GRP0_9BACT|nr:Uncharacterized protein dnm_062540 [Desulfonema magnum]
MPKISNLKKSDFNKRVHFIKNFPARFLIRSAKILFSHSGKILKNF